MHAFWHRPKTVCVLVYWGDSKQVIERPEAAGWVLNRVAGSHYQFRHPSRLGTTIVQHPRKHVPTGTRKSVERQSRVNMGD